MTILPSDKTTLPCDSLPSSLTANASALAKSPSGAPAPSCVASLTAAPAPAVVIAEPVSAPVAARVEPFVLPSDQLIAVAESAGLQWVNSDAEKIRAVQEAMAREPKPVHVPRERKPMVVVDEGPLVLVETRKDLSQITLPFDSAR